MAQPNAKFTKLHEMQSSFPIAYECGLLYFDQFRTCISMQSSRPCRLYSLGRCTTKQKIIDGCISQCPLECLPPGTSSYRGSFLALTADNFLCRYDVETGALLERLNLSSEYKFKSIAWVVEEHQLALTSSHTPLNGGRRALNYRQEVLMAIALISVYPLCYTAIIEISRSVFGEDILDAMACSGCLIVTHSKGLVRIYSLEHILSYQGNSSDASEYRFGSHVNSVHIPKEHDTRYIPRHIQLKDCPPVLFQLRCSQHALVLGGIPWQYIFTPFQSNGIFHVQTLDSEQLVEGGKLDMGNGPTMEPDKCYFHADDSGRIIHIGGSEIRLMSMTHLYYAPVYRLYKNHTSYSGAGGSPVHKLQLDYSINSKTTSGISCSASMSSNNQQHEAPPFPFVTQSGRIVKRPAKSQDQSDYESVIHCVDYEDELDIISLAVVKDTDISDSGEHEVEVHLHDNQTGQLLIIIPLEEMWNSANEHSIVLDRDTLVHTCKSNMDRKNYCYIYRLDRKPTDCCEQIQIPDRRAKPRTRNRIR